MTANDVADQVTWKNKYHLKQQRWNRLKAIWNSIGWLAVAGGGAALLWLIVR